MANRMATGSAFREACGFKRLLRQTTGLTSVLGLALLPSLALAQALPTGSDVVSGQVSVTTPDAANMLIQQGSDNAIVNWNSFSIGAGAQVTVQQPGSSSALLNRVTGATTSEIHGRLTANGQVHLVNPNGIFIGPTGRIQARGMVASTLDIADDDFRAGRLSYSGTGASAPVRNAGDIAIQSGGYAALLGGRVNNSGTVTVPLGRIGFAAGERVTLDLTGDQFLQVALPSADDGSDEALIDNSGTASAAGGRIEMKAATAREAVRQAINLSGVAEARSVSVRGGTVYLGGGPGGKVTVSGRVDTRASRATIVDRSPRPVARPVAGGEVTITGADIALTGAEIDASGSGGGTILIGGNFAGVGPLPHADTLTADAATTLRADGQDGTGGGRILLWSDLRTDFDGTISARGSDTGGDGGFVEVSSRAVLSYRGVTDLRAPAGDWGMLLLDPYNITVAAAGGGLGDSTVDVGTLETALGLGDVTLDTSTRSIGSETGIITIDADVTWTDATTLILFADNQININGTITADAGSLDASAIGLLQVDGAVSTNSGNVTLFGDTIALGAPISVGSGRLFATASGSLFANDPLSSTTGDLNLTASGLSGLSGLSTDGGDIVIFVGDDLDLIGAIDTNGGALSLEVFGSILPDSSVTVSAGQFRLEEGIWNQVGADIAAFESTDFWARSSATFLRAAGGDGSAGNPYVITDIFGLQGIDGSAISGSAFVLGNDIDASGTAGWTKPFSDALGLSPLGVFLPFTGSLDGAGFTIANLTSDTLEGAADFPNGFFREIDVGGSVRDLRLTNAWMEGGGGGLFVNTNRGTIEGVSIDGTGIYQGEGIRAGGFAAENFGIIRDSRTTATVNVDGYGQVGGFVGVNEAGGSITTSGTTATVTYFDGSGTGLRNALGGFVGQNNGTIADSRAVTDQTATVDPGNDGSSLDFGGFVGFNSGDIDTSLAVGTLDHTTACCITARLGGFAGVDGAGDGVTAANYWDLTVAALALSDGGTPLTTGQLQDTADFFARAALAGWDFDGTWAPGETAHYPVPYALEAVIFAQPDPFSVQYGLTDTASTTGSVSGGPSLFAFGPVGDGVDTSALFDDLILSDTVVGDQDATLVRPTLLSSLGQTYRVVDLPTVATVTPAPLTITAQDQTKQYGDLLVPDGTEFAVSALFGSDRVDSVTLTSTGFATTAQVDDAPFAITPSAALGVGLTNYDITYVDGALTLTLAPLTITADDVTKVYGTPFTFAGTEFSVAGLLGSDTVDSVTLVSSDFEPDNATVTDGPYAVTPSAAVGTGVTNYDIAYVDGTGTVTPAPRTVTANDQSKTYGSLLTFDGSEVTLDTPLLFSDTASFALSSPGAAAAATVAGSPYAITAGLAAGNANYSFTFVDGALTVTLAPLTITALDLSKTYGSAFAFDGDEFTTSGLLLSDSVTSVTLASPGAAADADVAGSPYAITPSAAVGTGLDNYDIAYAPGDLSVTPASRTIRALDQSKTYGTTFTFGGSEFTIDSPLLVGDLVTFGLSSAGAAATSAVLGSPYAIDVATGGADAGNYAFTVVPGDLTVTPAPLTVTANDATKQYGQALPFAGDEYTVSGLLFSDTVESVSLSSAGAAATAPVTVDPYAILPSFATGIGIGNYDVTYVRGDLSVTPAPRTVTILDQSKTYGTTLAFDDGDYAFDTPLLFGDTLDIGLASPGAAATAAADPDPYAITGTVVGHDPAVDGPLNYALSFDPGDLTVNRATLVVSALDRSKLPGESLTFDGTEIDVSGLAPGDSIAGVDLVSAGAGADAAGGAYPIVPSGARGIGLDNYDIVYAEGVLSVTVVSEPPPTITGPETATGPGPESGVSGVVNQRDTIVGLPERIAGVAGDGEAGGQAESGGEDEAEGEDQSESTATGVAAAGDQVAVARARETLVQVRGISASLGAQSQSCGPLAGSDVNGYLTCLSDALGSFAAGLDQISTDLPPGMENVARIVETARSEVDQARSRAQQRLAGATTAAERNAIRNDAIAEARGAVQRASDEIRKSIALVRVEDPELATLQRAQITETAAALDNVDIQLARVVGL